MATASKIALVREMLDSAEASIRSARSLLSEVAGGAGGVSARADFERAASSLSASSDGETKIVEGVFDGTKMIGPDGREYPVPANYASKSKLVPGDVMKLTINSAGGFLYKQIGPVERKRVVGPLTQEDGEFKVIAAGKAYKVLLASVTFYRAETGDEIVLLVPESGDSEWGAIDNVIPKLQADLAAEERLVKEANEMADETLENEED